MPRYRQIAATIAAFLIPLAAVGQTPPPTECDRLATHSEDDHAVATGVPWDELEGDAAVAACEAAVVRYPEAARLHFLHGRALNKLERYQDAMAAYRRALQLQPEYTVVHNNVANLYNEGLGVAQDDKLATKHYLAASELGFAVAQLKLGMAYGRGTGVEPDQTEAARWYLRAAEQGNVFAQENLGRRYRMGIGVEQDLAEAMKWSRRAAEQGAAGSQVEVGFLYRRGLGVEKDSG